jgi:peptidyl-prolyl cis-trans isomerase C
MAEYQAELARFRAASGTGMATYGEEKVLEDMIDQLLMAQAAYEAGFVVDEQLVQKRIDQLNVGEGALTEWLAAHGYTEATFREALARAIAAAWLRDQVAGQVPETADQVHARQILRYTAEEANEVYAELESGVDFETLAAEYAPLTQGDLGWFPRGYLSEPALSEAAFSLEPGAYSSVIETRLGYHILQVLDRETQRPLTFDARQVLQLQALNEWLQEFRDQSEINILVP